MKKSEKRSNKIKTIVSIIGFLLCTLLLLYPLISNKWNQYRDKQIIDRYIDEVNTGDKEHNESELKKAREYNKSLYLNNRNIVNEAEHTTDAAYEALLNSTGTGIMCYIEIPKIDVTEPIYHYSNDEALDKGVGHIHGSSLPVGGTATHSVLTGHRGLPSQKIFSDLDRIEKGDSFYIHILGHTLKYDVYNIKVVTPNDVSDLTIEKGEDLITLVTCEPYGINTHRLLIMGKRVDFDETKVENGLVTTEVHEKIIDPAFMIFVGFMIFLILFAVLILTRRTIAKRKEAPKAPKVPKAQKPVREKKRREKAPVPIMPKKKKRFAFASQLKKKQRKEPTFAAKPIKQSEPTATVTEVVYVKEDTSKAKHSPIVYIMSGIALGAAIAGIILIIYKLIKKNKDSNDKK